MSITFTETMETLIYVSIIFSCSTIQGGLPTRGDFKGRKLREY